MLDLLNWILVSIYWTMLSDLGQSFPVVYGFDYDTENYVHTTFPATNNIFINSTLFYHYYSYLNSTVLPILTFDTNITEADAVIPWFEMISPANRLNMSNATFIRSYSCNKRQLKSWLELIISVIVGDYALIGVPYTIAVFFAVAIQKRVQRDCEFTL